MKEEAKQQPFEKHKELGAILYHAAHNWKTDMQWSALLEQINILCLKLEGTPHHSSESVEEAGHSHIYSTLENQSYPRKCTICGNEEPETDWKDVKAKRMSIALKLPQPLMRLWTEIQVWYGDIQKSESEVEFLNRINKEYPLASFQSLQGKGSKTDFLSVLEENYLASLNNKYNLTSCAKATREVVLQTYQDLISIYKSMQSSTSVTEGWIRVEDENITTLPNTTDYAVIFKHTGAKEVKTGFAIKVHPFFYSHYMPLHPLPNTK